MAIFHSIQMCQALYTSSTQPYLPISSKRSPGKKRPQKYFISQQNFHLKLHFSCVEQLSMVEWLKEYLSVDFFATKPLLFYSLVGLVPLHFTPAGQTHYSDQISGLLYSQRQISKENLKRPFQKWYRKMWHVIKQLAIKFFHAGVKL